MRKPLAPEPGMGKPWKPGLKSVTGWGAAAGLVSLLGISDGDRKELLIVVEVPLEEIEKFPKWVLTDSFDDGV